MGIIEALSMTLGEAPDSSGSGGGPNTSLLTETAPQGLLGLNSVVVYGGNFQIAFPINVQMAVGSNLQICINPAAFATLYGNGADVVQAPPVNAILGSGIGGNMQLTMGTSANFVMGQSFDINLGPRRITMDVHNASGIHKAVSVLGTIIIGVVVIFLLAYGLTSDDDKRATLLIFFQFALQVMLMALMDTEHIYNSMDSTGQAAIDGTFGNDTAHPNAGFKDTWGEKTGSAQLAGLAALLLMFLPIVLESVGEAKLHDPQPPTVVVDSSGHQIGTVQD